MDRFDMQSVMVVDDEAMVLLDLVMMVEDLGYQVHSDSTTVTGALEQLDGSEPDVALLDIDVGGEPVWPLARKVAEHGRPIVFVSANLSHRELCEEFANAQKLEKPVSPDEIRAALSAALGQV